MRTLIPRRCRSPIEGESRLDLAIASLRGRVTVLLGAGTAPRQRRFVARRSRSVIGRGRRLQRRPDTPMSRSPTNCPTTSAMLSGRAGPSASRPITPQRESRVGYVRRVRRRLDPDLAVANLFSGTVSIALGQGDGAFGAATASPPGRPRFRLRSATSTATRTPTWGSRRDLGDPSVLLGARRHLRWAEPVPFGSRPVSSPSVISTATRIATWRCEHSAPTCPLLGAGDATFPTTTQFDADQGPSSVAVGDSTTTRDPTSPSATRSPMMSRSS